jgi:hypothetical protein
VPFDGPQCRLRGRWLRGCPLTSLSPRRVPPNRPGFVGTGGADAYLAFDALTATSATNLDRCAPDRTVAVVSTSEVPTGKTVTDPHAVFPSGGSLSGTIAECTRADRMVSFDALAMAEELFGATTAANFLVIGAAYQSGVPGGPQARPGTGMASIDRGGRAD